MDEEAVNEAVDKTWGRFSECSGGLSKEQWLAGLTERLDDPLFRRKVEALHALLSDAAEKLHLQYPMVTHEDAFHVLLLGVLEPEIRLEDMPPLVTTEDLGD